jgi:hypothetical protein
LHDELSGDGFGVIAVAIDEHADAVRPLTDGITYPVLIDREHLLTELLAISNVPTVVWLDEAGRIARPNATEFGSNTFAEFTGVDADEHKDLVRAWVRDGIVPLAPEEAADAVTDLDADELAARLHFRIAVHLQREGDTEGAERNFDRAVALAPLDFTISRASLPLRGGNPFGEEFMATYAEWKAAGSPFHGIGRELKG